MTGREAMLDRIRAAVAAGASTTPVPPIPRAYQRAGSHAAGSEHVLELLVDRLIDYKAEVTVVSGDQLADAVDTALGAAGSVVVPAGLPAPVRAGCAQSGRTVVDGRPAPHVDRR